MTVSPPQHFLCPITNKVMTDPVISRTGHSFERHAILQWFDQGNHTCPVTSKPLKLSGLISNTSLKSKIQVWMKQHMEENNDNVQQQEEYEKLQYKVPMKKFYCQLSGRIMKDPVMSRYGHNFERKTIMSWFHVKGYFCPITGKPLKLADLVSNGGLQWEIEHWNRMHGQRHATNTLKEMGCNRVNLVTKDFEMLGLICAPTSDEVSVQSTKTEKTTLTSNSKSVTALLDELDDILGYNNLE